MSFLHNGIIELQVCNKTSTVLSAAENEGRELMKRERERKNEVKHTKILNVKERNRERKGPESVIGR